MNEIKNDSKRIEEFLMICQMLQLFVGDTEVLPSSNELLEIFGRVRRKLNIVIIQIN